jgi:hypothetical protein
MQAARTINTPRHRTVVTLLAALFALCLCLSLTASHAAGQSAVNCEYQFNCTNDDGQAPPPPATGTGATPGSPGSPGSSVSGQAAAGPDAASSFYAGTGSVKGDSNSSLPFTGYPVSPLVLLLLGLLLAGLAARAVLAVRDHLRDAGSAA